MELLEDRLDIGLLGAPDVVAAFLRAALATERARPAAVAGAAPAGAPAGIRRYADLPTLLDDPAVDTLVLAGSAAENLRGAWAAIRAGRHVLLGAAFPADEAAVAEVVAAAEETGVCLAVAFQGRRWPAARELRRRLAAGEGATALVAVTGRPDPSAAALTRADAIDLLLHLFGRVDSVQAVAGEDGALAASLRFAGGILASVVFADRAPADLVLRVHHPGAILSVADPGTLFLEAASGGEVLPVPGPDPLTAALDDLATAVLDHEEPETGGLEAVAAVRVLAALDRAARSGRALGG